MIARKLFYMDTNCLVFARHYVICKAINEEYYPQTVQTGKVVVEAFDHCDQKSVDLFTSNLVNFEINRRFRTSEIKRVFIEYGIPLEAVDGRPQDITAPLPNWSQHMKDKLNERVKTSQEWYRDWEYRRLVRFVGLDPQIFELAEAMPFISPGIDLMDSLHVATALHHGAHYFVSNDGPLINHAKRIIEDALNQGRLSNGEEYPRGEEIHEPMKAIKPKEFRDEAAKLPSTNDDAGS